MASGIMLGGVAEGLPAGAKSAVSLLEEKRTAEAAQRAEINKLIETNMAQIGAIFKETAAAGGSVAALPDNPAVQAHLAFIQKYAPAIGQDPGIYDARVRTMSLAKPAEEAVAKPVAVNPGQTLVHPQSGKVIYSSPLIDPMTGTATPVAQADTIAPVQAARVNAPVPSEAALPANAAPVAAAASPFAERFQEPAPPAPAPNPNVNEDAIVALSPGAQNLVKGVADGTVDPVKAFSAKQGKDGQSERRKFLEKVKEYDPSFDMANYGARSATLKAFKSGVEARKLTALGTVVGHVGELYKDGEALDNWKSDTFGPGTKAVNTIRNWVQENKQSPIVRRFELSATAVSNELENAFRGSSTAISGIQEWRKSINPAMASDEITQSTQKLGSLLAARMSEMKEQWDRGMGHNQDPSIALKLAKTRELIEKMAAGTLFSDKSVAGTPAAAKSDPLGLR